MGSGSSIKASDLFEVLLQENSESLLAFIRASVRDPGLVDDVFQETAIAAWKSIDKFDRTKPFGAWLRGIAGNLILAARRKNARQVVPVDLEMLDVMNQELQNWQRMPGDTLDEKLDALRGCVAKLASPYDAVIRMRYQEQAEMEEMAGQLDTNIETVKKRLQRARAQLLDCVQRKLANGATV